MSALTPVAVLALSLLSEQPMHPYEMLQTMRVRRSDRLAKVGPGVLYHAVDRMVRDGYAEPERTDRGGNRPERTIYRITPLGREAVADALTDMLATPAPEYPRLPVALSELHNLPLEQAAELLQRRGQALRVKVAELSEVRTMLAERPLAARFLLDLDYTTAMAAAERDWIAQTLAALRSGQLEWPDPTSTPHDLDTEPDTKDPA